MKITRSLFAVLAAAALLLGLFIITVQPAAGEDPGSTRATLKWTSIGLGTTFLMDDLVEKSGGVVTGADPNYYIHGDITIQWGDALEVKPGQNLNFDPETNLSIKGSLIAVGTSNTQRDIVFTYNSSLAEPWNGIKFLETSNDDKCRLQYCQISNAIRGVECLDSSPRIEDCTITQCERAAIDLKNSECRINRNTLSNSQYGVFVDDGSTGLLKGNTLKGNGDGMRIYSDDITVEANKFQQNNFNGLYLFEASAVLKNNNISDNKGTGIQAQSSSLSVIGGKINENSRDGIKINSRLDRSATSVEITDTEIMGNLKNGIHCNNTVLTITGTTIKNNIEIGLACYDTDADIDDCLFLYNGWDSVGALWNFSALYAYGSSLNIESTSIMNSAFAGLELVDTDADVYNCTLKSSQMSHYHLSGSSWVHNVNTALGTDDGKAVKIVGSGSKLNVWWYLDLRFLDKEMQEAVTGAQVEVGPNSYVFSELGASNSSAYYTGTTDASGKVPTITCLEKIFSGTKVSNQNPIRVYSKDPVHGLKQEDIDLTGSLDLTILLEPPGEIQITLANLYDNKLIEETETIRGYVISNTPIESVEWRMDNETWKTADGVDLFNVTINPSFYASGNHTIEFRAFTGQEYSEAVSYTIRTLTFEDSDNDGLSDVDEINIYGTDPDDPDTDSDWISDGVEVDGSDGATTDPLDPDTDDDLVLDGDEDTNRNGRVDPGEWDPNDNTSFPNTPSTVNDTKDEPVSPTVILMWLLILAIVIVILLIIGGMYYTNKKRGTPDDEEDQEPSRVSTSISRLPRDRKRRASKDDEEEEEKPKKRSRKKGGGEDDEDDGGGKKRRSGRGRKEDD